MPVCPACRVLSTPGPACASCGNAFVPLATPSASAADADARPGLVSGLAITQIIVGTIALLALLVMLPLYFLLGAFLFAFTGESAPLWATLAILALMFGSGLLATGIGLLGGHRWAWVGSLVCLGGIGLINLALAANGDLSRMLVVGAIVAGAILLFQDSVRAYCDAE